MPNYAIRSTLKTVESYVKTHSRTRNAQIGEFKSPPTSRAAASIFMAGVRMPVIRMSATTRVYDVVVRFYVSFLEDGDVTETMMADIVSDFLDDIEPDADLGGNIRNVDLGGQHGRPLEVEFTYVDIERTVFRVADVMLPLIVDSAAGSAAA